MKKKTLTLIMTIALIGSISMFALADKTPNSSHPLLLSEHMTSVTKQINVTRKEDDTYKEYEHYGVGNRIPLYRWNGQMFEAVTTMYYFPVYGDDTITHVASTTDPKSPQSTLDMRPLFASELNKVIDDGAKKYFMVEAGDALYLYDELNLRKIADHVAGDVAVEKDRLPEDQGNVDAPKISKEDILNAIEFGGYEFQYNNDFEGFMTRSIAPEIIEKRAKDLEEKAALKQQILNEQYAAQQAAYAAAQQALENQDDTATQDDSWVDNSEETSADDTQDTNTGEETTETETETESQKDTEKEKETEKETDGGSENEIIWE